MPAAPAAMPRPPVRRAARKPSKPEEKVKQRRETKQRQLTLQAVRAYTDHPSANQIYEEVHALNKHISRGTVYRNLNCLAEDGEICHVRVPGADRYDLRTDLHCHIFCTVCGAVYDAPLAYQAALDDQVAAATGFAVQRHRLLFEGICPTCRSRQG